MTRTPSDERREPAAVMLGEAKRETAGPAGVVDGGETCRRVFENEAAACELCPSAFFGGDSSCGGVAVQIVAPAH
jgi:hypothetical protein